VRPEPASTAPKPTAVRRSWDIRRQRDQATVTDAAPPLVQRLASARSASPTDRRGDQADPYEPAAPSRARRREPHRTAGMRACEHCGSATLRDKRVISGQTLKAVTARLPMGRPHPSDRGRPALLDRAAGSQRRDRIRIGVGRLARRAGLERHFGRTEETDVLHAAAGHRCATVTSLNWRATSPHADCNPLRYAPEMVMGAACACLASMDVTPGPGRYPVATSLQVGMCPAHRPGRPRRRPGRRRRLPRRRPVHPRLGVLRAASEPGWDTARVARAWAELMSRLGYERYGAQGGSTTGALVPPQFRRIDSDHIVGVHVNNLLTLPSGNPAIWTTSTTLSRSALSS
jgi:hypothetical protein